MATLADARGVYEDVVAEKCRRDPVFWAERNFYAEETVFTPEGLIQLMPHQRMILRYAFQRDETGRFRFTTIIYSAVKKSGKTAMGGLVGRWAAETWTRRGDVYFVGNDANQAKERGYAALRSSIELNPEYNPMKERLPGQWIIHDKYGRHIPTGSKAHAVATDYKGEAGSNPVLSVWTEIWGFIQTASLRFWAEMTPSPTRAASVRFIETYAGFVGESELLEGLYNNVVKPECQLTNQHLMDVLGDSAKAPCS